MLLSSLGKLNISLLSFDFINLCTCGLDFITIYKNTDIFFSENQFQDKRARHFYCALFYNISFTPSSFNLTKKLEEAERTRQKVKNPSAVAEWSKTLVQIQVAISLLHSQAQSLLGTYIDGSWSILMLIRLEIPYECHWKVPKLVRGCYTLWRIWIKWLQRGNYMI